MLGASLGDLGCACLIMELVAGGDLASHIHDRHKRRLTYIEILQVLVFIVLISCSAPTRAGTVRAVSVSCANRTSWQIRSQRWTAAA